MCEIYNIYHLNVWNNQLFLNMTSTRWVYCHWHDEIHVQWNMFHYATAPPSIFPLDLLNMPLLVIILKQSVFPLLKLLQCTMCIISSSNEMMWANSVFYPGMPPMSASFTSPAFPGYAQYPPPVSTTRMAGRKRSSFIYWTSEAEREGDGNKWMRWTKTKLHLYGAWLKYGNLQCWKYVLCINWQRCDRDSTIRSSI